MIDDAERQGLLHPHTGSRIFEGTVGSTGISIATVAKARYAIAHSLQLRSERCNVYLEDMRRVRIYLLELNARRTDVHSHLLAIIMPDDVAQEKVQALLALGAEVERVRPASIVDKKQVSSKPLFLRISAHV